MSKKTIKANSVNETHGNIEFEQGGDELSSIVEMASEQTEPKQPEPEKKNNIYLRDTIIQMDEFKKYGLNQYFLRAILTENYYTLDKAHKLIQDFLNKH
jgi:hypothetical protein